MANSKTLLQNSVYSITHTGVRKPFDTRREGGSEELDRGRDGGIFLTTLAAGKSVLVPGWLGEDCVLDVAASFTERQRSKHIILFQ